MGRQRERGDRLRTNSQRQDWLFAFYGRDLTSLSREEWEELGRDFYTFSSYAGGLRMIIPWPDEADESGPLLYSQNTVKRAQARLRQAVDDFLSGTPTEEWEGKVAVRVVRLRSKPSPWSQPVYAKRTSCAGVLFLFILEMVEVLTRVGHKLAHCKAPKTGSTEPCGRLIVKTKRHQAYCSNECRSRDAMRQLRRKEREERERAAPARRKKGK